MKGYIICCVKSSFINVLFCVFVWHQVADTAVEHKEEEQQQQTHDETQQQQQQQQQHTSWGELLPKTGKSITTWKTHRIHSQNPYFTITVGLRLC